MPSRLGPLGRRLGRQLPLLRRRRLRSLQEGLVKHLHESSLIGSDRPYHYMGSGKFFVRFGDLLAEAMANLLKKIPG